jgi:DNA gyrase subunit A
MLMSSNGTLIRTPAVDVSVLGRNTQGVRLIKLDEGERLIGVETVDAEEAEAGNGEEGEEGAAPAPAGE